MPRCKKSSSTELTGLKAKWSLPLFKNYSPLEMSFDCHSIQNDRAGLGIGVSRIQGSSGY